MALFWHFHFSPSVRVTDGVFKENKTVKTIHTFYCYSFGLLPPFPSVRIGRVFYIIK